MHLAHHISWETVVRHLEVEQLDNNIFHNAVSTTTKGLSTEYAEMNHFLRKFVRTIRDFSATERVKYSTKPDLVSKGKVFSDEILRKYASSTTNGLWDHDSVSRDTQQIEAWLRNIPRKERSDPVGLEHAPKYARVVGVCLNENELTPLLMLAVHPKCDVKSLYSFGQGVDYGWGELVEAALTLYIFVNVVGNSPALLDDKNLPHDQFWDSRTTPRAPTEDLEEPSGNHMKIVDFFQDTGELKEYLKQCWRVIYCSDMLMRECGIEADWETMIVRCMEGWGFEGKQRRLWFPDCGVWDAGRGTYSGTWGDAAPIEIGSSQKRKKATGD